MVWLSDEMLFYGGIAVAACSLVIAMIVICIFKIKSIRLNSCLDAEYGKEEDFERH